MLYKLLSIDAWREYEGWSWNDVCILEQDIEIPDNVQMADWLLDYLIDSNYIDAKYRDRLDITEYGEDCHEVQDMDSESPFEPLFALEPMDS